MPIISLPSAPLVFARPVAFLLLGLAVVLYFIHRASVRGLTQGRGRFVFAVRLLVLLLLVTSMAGPIAVNSVDSLGVAFLVDLSDSVSPEQQGQALTWMRQAMAAKRPRDQGEVIAFAKDALIDRPLSATTDVANFASTPVRDQTNLAVAIRLAISTLPSSAARKIVVLSDGAENSGNALDEARLAAAAGIPISFVPLAGRDGPEVLVRQVETPSALREEDTFNLRIVVDANVATPATIHLLIDGRLDSTHLVKLSQESNVFTIPRAPLPKGFHTFQVQLEAPADTILENNEGISYSTVVGQARVLIVEGASGEGRYLTDALRAGGLDVVVRPPLSVATDATGLRDFDSVLLVNVRADLLSQAQQQAIKAYVQSFAGGLVVVGGDHSYSVGGYARTPLEEALPVRMDLRGRKVQSSVALMLVVDTSGSMGEGPAGATKMDLAKKAAIESVALLGEQDQIGIVAFEDNWRWIVEPTYLKAPEQVKRKIGTLAPGGGTEIYPALKEAYRAMAQREAKVRHIILMTDGLAPPGDYDGLTKRMRADNITLSTIAVGTDADFGLLQHLAEAGKGRYYEGLDPFDVPQLTVKETLEVSRAAIVEEQVHPARAGASSILDGLDLGSMPPLAGYVATMAKPSSTTVLVSKELDPLLVEWQYGLGQVIAWTSDAENHWAADWLSWDQFSQFWSQLVKRTIPASLDRNIHLTVRQEGTQAHVIVDSLGDDGSYLNLLQSEATVIDPKGSEQKMALRQSAPGRYEGFFSATAEGAYAIAVTQRTGSDHAPVAAQAGGLAVSYSPEYRDLGGNAPLLSGLAAETGGSALASPAQAFLRPERAAGGGRELWPYFVAAALVLFLLDVAARRLRVGQADIRRGWHLLLEPWRVRGRPIASPAAGRLLSVKRRLSHGDANHLKRSALRDPGSAGAVARSNTSGDTRQAASKEPTGTAAMGARLMEAKRRASKEKQ